MLNIQFDLTATGSLYVGNSGVAANLCGLNTEP